MLPENIRKILVQRPLGLVFDIDGTLSPIAPTPDQAQLYPGVVPLLKKARNHAHVAIMTGRDIEDGAAMINLDGITYIGAHGLEWSDGLPSSHPVKIVPEALAYINPGKRLLDLAKKELSWLPGIIVEPKRVGGAIHYRLSPVPDQARKNILSVLEGPTSRAYMRLSQGKRVIEVKTSLTMNKGQALRRFVQRSRLCSVIFAGDDRTDLDALKEIPHLREEGVAALAIVVRHTDTLPELLERADVVVEGVEGMVALLREIVAVL